MKDYRNSRACMAKVGLLFLKDCGMEVRNLCKGCGRPICLDHSVTTEQGVLCPECAANTTQRGQQGMNSNRGVRSSLDRGRYYDAYGYAPYYYGYAHYYSDRDYRTFDGNEPESVAPPEEDGSLGMADDDGMES